MSREFESEIGRHDGEAPRLHVVAKVRCSFRIRLGAQELDQVPDFRVAEARRESGHRRPRYAVRDPPEKFPHPMTGRVRGQVRRHDRQCKCSGTVSATMGAVAGTAILRIETGAADNRVSRVAYRRCSIGCRIRGHRK